MLKAQHWGYTSAPTTIPAPVHSSSHRLPCIGVLICASPSDPALPHLANVWLWDPRSQAIRIHGNTWYCFMISLWGSELVQVRPHLTQPRIITACCVQWHLSWISKDQCSKQRRGGTFQKEGMCAPEGRGEFRNDSCLKWVFCVGG